MLIEFIKENKKLIIVIIIFLVILLLFNTLKETKDKNKVDNSENYVYTYKEKFALPEMVIEEESSVVSTVN